MAHQGQIDRQDVRPSRAKSPPNTRVMSQDIGDSVNPQGSPRCVERGRGQRPFMSKGYDRRWSRRHVPVIRYPASPRLRLLVRTATRAKVFGMSNGSEATSPDQAPWLRRPAPAADAGLGPSATSTRSAGVTASSCLPALRTLCAFISRCVVPPVGLPAASSHLSPVTIPARRHRSGGRLHRPGHPDHPRRPRDPSLGPNPSLARLH